ncbi:MAG: TIGR03905 family TSCPD domain-containing protein [Eubacteriales bacterium]|nr:TIGR03905 family TSCPD domain-containing protein [Eubacteriales bacterium]
MTYTYTPHGVCSRQIQIDIDENTDTINSVSFIGGCNGNLQGIAALVKGKKPEEVISVLKGIDCNFKGTSCPDQLARALEEVEEQL